MNNRQLKTSVSCVTDCLNPSATQNLTGPTAGAVSMKKSLFEHTAALMIKH